MANLQNILGTLLATGMGGHSRRSPQDLGSILNRSGMGAGPAMHARGGMGVGPMAGLGALAYLAYRAYQERQQNMPSSGQNPARSGQPGSSPWGAPPSGSGNTPGGILGGILGGAGASGGGSLGERLSQVFQQRTAPPPDAAPSGSGEGAFPELAMEDQHALLLIRAMIAAANADGEISAAERQRVMSALDEAGGGPEERQIVERELSQPQSLDSLVRSVTDPDMAEQVYLASLMAVDREHEAERAYLSYLATRLKIAPQRAEQLNQAA
ncbi:tellurite resistance TerB family protein [Azospirillum brasilense]|uniref:Tellurite resistance TerB family protein n=1 Tax=Azospirillum brasilense TaxID=192 RepID=A0A6L3B5J5_AZOBR|nr:tellurite resistance TerB family protein [Azospirillum brasilense]KAA0687686.1 tellurite resistance TerB family protein [Azospirillum brasilense]